MTKYQEIDAIQYINTFLEKLPPDISVYTLYLYLKEREEEIQKSLTVKDKFSHQLYKCKCST